MPFVDIQKGKLGASKLEPNVIHFGKAHIVIPDGVADSFVQEQVEVPETNSNREVIKLNMLYDQEEKLIRLVQATNNEFSFTASRNRQGANGSGKHNFSVSVPRALLRVGAERGKYERVAPGHAQTGIDFRYVGPINN